ncbi:MAG: glycosyltransferase family 2 protein [Longimicrobiaceae bacterium]
MSRSPSAPPRVTAVVLNWCGEADTAACLRSLLASDYPMLHILLVDNGSPDGSGERLHCAFPQVEYLHVGENTGYSGGNNRGIERALEGGAEFVLVLNNDTLVEPDCVARLVEVACATREVGAVGGKILYFDAPARIWFGGGDFSRLRAVGLHRHEREADPDPTGGAVEEVSFLTGCCLLIPARVLREVGPFEEDFFMYVEDLDLTYRMRAAGYRLLYQPGARLLHRVAPDAAPPTSRQIVLRDRNRRRFVRRRYGRADRLRFALFFYPTRVVQAARYLLRGDGGRAVAIWHGMTLR